MKPIRKDYPKVRQYKKSGNTYYQVDLRRKHYRGPGLKWFSVRQEALQFASGIASKVSKSGLDSISLVGVDPRVEIWCKQCAVYGESLDRAIEVALGLFQKERQVRESHYMGELLTLWVDDKLTNKLKPLREASKKAIRNMAEIFKSDFGMLRIKEITRDKLEVYISSKNCSQQYRKNLHS